MLPSLRGEVSGRRKTKRQVVPELITLKCDEPSNTHAFTLKRVGVIFSLLMSTAWNSFENLPHLHTFFIVFF